MNDRVAFGAGLIGLPTKTAIDGAAYCGWKLASGKVGDNSKRPRALTVRAEATA